MKGILFVILTCSAFAATTQPTKVAKLLVTTVSNPGACRNRPTCWAKHQHYHVRSAKTRPEGKP